MGLWSCKDHIITHKSQAFSILNFLIPRRGSGALLVCCARSALGPRLRGNDEGAGMTSLSFLLFFYVLKLISSTILQMPSSLLI
ncbi:hypothetical protein CbuK_0820 [Coxiella burnetii CbuK_Q154]|nr:hypothetical protein [Coxiella burnetii]ACJ20063.1 hypothetical protein CbuK_0820 [Coxiella burnetii CbuK_Q154]EAX33707.1 hypothetical protein A35_04105 [Coxiella burnetii 'MSU Goat Q177']PHH58172.1 hypothetical protein CRH12_01580 [Coxiella burnetii]UYK70602.1 hypothetical protein OHM78_05135 [Coxiella burnetii]